MDTIFPAQDYDAVLFDLDGVLTDTASLHQHTWQQLFEQYRQQRAAAGHDDFAAFNGSQDYYQYLDGKPRYDGVQSFLQSRGIELDHGTPDDPPDAETVCGLGNRKNQYFLEQLQTGSITVFQDALTFLEHLQHQGIRCGVFTSSRNGHRILSQTQLLSHFDVALDGEDLATLAIPGKPDPAMLKECAKRLNVSPHRSVVIEDAISGIQAGRRGAFSLVIGIDRDDHVNALYQAGADCVVGSLSELHFE